ncbi:MAG: putative lipid II flippase FtsW [Candidatus Moraniibacteriota bacterium]|nr:MAG: putative lipid II flippase FtsW [Candidatus Moranbacteria bacterium]
MSLIAGINLTTMYHYLRSKKSSMPRLKLTYSSQIIITTLILLAFGLLMIGSASVAEGARDFGDKWHFVGLQLKWAFTGIIFSWLFSRLHPHFWQKLAFPIIGIGIVLLILVLIPGIGTKVLGARRWLVLPGVVIQPSELIKLIEVIYLSSWFTRKRVSLLQFGSFALLISGLIMLQPDLGTTIVVSCLGIAMYFITGYPVKHLLTVGLVGAIVLTIYIFSSTYRIDRVKTFLDPTHDPLGSSYHIRQVVLALGSGGITGLGIGRSRQKYEYLPESTTDSIVAVVGEELGFIGILLLIFTFLYLISLVFKVAAASRDEYNSALAAGIGSWIAIQLVLNLAAMVALTPLTGIPLPLVSYGGSSLITILVGIGLVLAVSRVEKI